MEVLERSNKKLLKINWKTLIITKGIFLFYHKIKIKKTLNKRN